MFHRSKGPAKPFSHQDGCKILKADPSVVIPWSEVETGLWTAECQCGKEYFRAPVSDDRIRQDPLDPKTARHGGACEFADATDRAMLRAVLRVVPKDGYAWVECNACSYGWQVPDYAEQKGEER